MKLIEFDKLTNEKKFKGERIIINLDKLNFISSYKAGGCRLVFDGGEVLVAEDLDSVLKRIVDIVV